MDESTPAPYLCQFCMSKEEEQVVQDNIDTCLMKGWKKPSTS